MTDAIARQKSELRAAMRGVLDAMSDEQRRSASLAACARLSELEAVRAASVLMLYMPLTREVDLTSFAVGCFRAQKTVCLPQVDWKRKQMKAVEVGSFDDDIMQVDEHGVRSPRDGRPVTPQSLDLVVVPGLAFDTAGRRLGRGAGFYDRFLCTLRRNAVKVGLAFDAQVAPTIPTLGHDCVMDVLVTDRRVTVCKLSSSDNPT
jgi:5-formyltetrahydrofolate cyclo-ligase